MPQRCFGLTAHATEEKKKGDKIQFCNKKRNSWQYNVRTDRRNLLHNAQRITGEWWKAYLRKHHYAVAVGSESDRLHSRAASL